MRGESLPGQCPACAEHPGHPHPHAFAPSFAAPSSLPRQPIDETRGHVLRADVQGLRHHRVRVRLLHLFQRLAHGLLQLFVRVVHVQQKRAHPHAHPLSGKHLDHAGAQPARCQVCEELLEAGSGRAAHHVAGVVHAQQQLLRVLRRVHLLQRQPHDVPGRLRHDKTQLRVVGIQRVPPRVHRRRQQAASFLELPAAVLALRILHLRHPQSGRDDPLHQEGRQDAQRHLAEQVGGATYVPPAVRDHDAQKQLLDLRRGEGHVVGLNLQHELVQQVHAVQLVAYVDVVPNVVQVYQEDVHYIGCVPPQHRTPVLQQLREHRQGDVPLIRDGPHKVGRVQGVLAPREGHRQGGKLAARLRLHGDVDARLHVQEREEELEVERLRGGDGALCVGRDDAVLEEDVLQYREQVKEGVQLRRCLNVDDVGRRDGARDDGCLLPVHLRRPKQKVLEGDEDVDLRRVGGRAEHRQGAAPDLPSLDVV
eukprot:Rhum_TRINITY_DN4842_c0_g1::Rhum_TRINITY_DN4842_c0_g1_i1::g.15735::m.15735